MPDDGAYATIDRLLAGLLPGGVAPGALPGGGAIPFTPAAGAMATAASPLGVPIVAQAQQVTAFKAPKGYVLVTLPSGQRVAMLKPVAYALHLRKRPTKGGITAREIQAARRVQSVISSLTVARKPRMPLKRGRRR